MSEYDPWAGGTGLWEGVATIVDGNFFKDAQQESYSWQGQLKADDGEDVEVRYGLGRDWQSYDGGETIEHPRGAAHLFNKQGAYYDFFTSAIAAGAGDVLKQRGRDHNDLGPKWAKVFNGLRFEWEVVERDGRRPNEEGVWQEVKINRTLPKKYLGENGQGTLNVQEVSVAATPTPASSAPSANGPAADVSPGGGGSSLAVAGLDVRDMAKLGVLAKTNDYRGFVDAAMALQATDGSDMVLNADLMQRLADQAFYEGLKSG